MLKSGNLGETSPEHIPPLTRTVSTTGAHDYQVGNWIEIRTLDPRKWKRFLHWVTLRAPPIRVERVQIRSVSSQSFVVTDQKLCP